MRMSEGVEWAAHCCLLLDWIGDADPVPTAQLAAAFELPPPYLNKQLQALVRAGILTSTRGKRGGFALARALDRITLLDVVDAIEGPDPAFRCTEIRRRGPAAVPAREYRALCGIHRAMLRADDAWRDELRATTVADLAAGVLQDASPKSLELGAAWAATIRGGS